MSSVVHALKTLLIANCTSICTVPDTQGTTLNPVVHAVQQHNILEHALQYLSLPSYSLSISSVFQIILRRMAGRQVIPEKEGIWKESVLTYAISQHIPGQTEENYRKPQ
jgi:hypothetical protein